MVLVDCGIILIDFVHRFLFYAFLGIPKILFVFASCPERLFQLSCMGNSIDKYKKEKKESTDGILFVGIAFIVIGIFSSSSCRRLFLWLLIFGWLSLFLGSFSADGNVYHTFGIIYCIVPGLIVATITFQDNIRCS